MLRELRARVVEALDQSQCVRDVEPLARRLAAISAEIDELAGQREPQGTPVDVIRARREAGRRNGKVVTYSHAEVRGEQAHG